MMCQLVHLLASGYFVEVSLLDWSKKSINDVKELVEFKTFDYMLGLACGEC